MPNKLEVDPEAMKNAARIFRNLPASLNGPQTGLFPVVLSIGDFADGNSLKKVIDSGVKDWETVLAVLKNVFVDIDGVLVNAATLLLDADESNNAFVLDDIRSLTS